jgi:hypothetical protein
VLVSALYLASSSSTCASPCSPSPWPCFWIAVDTRTGEQRSARQLATRLDVVGITGFGGALAALRVFLMSLPTPIGSPGGSGWLSGRDWCGGSCGPPVRFLTCVCWRPTGSIASSALISIVFHSRVNDHGLHTIALIMVSVSAPGLIVVLADRNVMAQDRVRRDDRSADNQ